MISIGSRIYRAIALVSLVSLLAMFAITAWVSEDLESTMLKVEMANERDFFIAQQFEPGRPVHRQFSGLTVVYLPAGHKLSSIDDTQADLPMLFKGVAPPYSGEVRYHDETYLVSATALDGGIMYLARNITHFEQREWMFRVAMLVSLVLIAALIVVLATLGAKRVVKPLQNLSDQIRAMQVGAQMQRLPTEWRDSELQAIAQSFNEFVGHLEAFVRREKSLLNLASHELRTPLTVARIRRATEEMQSNVDILLALARKDQGASVVATSVSLSTEVNRVLDDLAGSYSVQSRVELRAFAPGQVVADATMVRMLLRNLVQNALQHTRRRVFITVHADYFDVRDEGEGLSSQAQDVLAGRVTLGQEPGAVHGLGLYLVTLMIERLGWTLQVVDASSQGTLLRVFYPQS
jgi:signal transduction histidine kinase